MIPLAGAQPVAKLQEQSCDGSGNEFKLPLLLLKSKMHSFSYVFPHFCEP